jgi:shikimate kinase
MSAKRHIVLVGLPGSGKSVVGRLVADALRTQLVDVDEVIEQELGMPIARIFADKGEPEFRRLERAAVARVFSEEPCVVAPGGGWAAQQGTLSAAMPRALTVYLRVTPEVAAARTTGKGHRPLLGDGEHASKLTALLKEREPYYSGCETAVGTDGRDAEAVASDVTALARNKGGW